jgi:hypothetical protein
MDGMGMYGVIWVEVFGSLGWPFGLSYLCTSMWKRFGPLNLPAWEKELLALWEKEKTFERTLAQREGCPAFVFYEGPPSANGKPGIHHVFSRTPKTSCAATRQ